MRQLTLLAFLIPSLLSAQQPFPELAGETADGHAIVLPLKGLTEYTIIGLAYSQKAEPALEAWFEPAYLRFVSKHGLFASTYQCDVFFVPLFTGVNKAAYEPSMNKFRKGAAPGVVKHVVFSKADLDGLKASLGLEERDIPYFFVLDSEGRILYREQGAFSDEKLDAMEEVMIQ